MCRAVAKRKIELSVAQHILEGIPPVTLKLKLDP